MAFEKSIEKFDALLRYLNNDVKTIIGVEAVNHFKESFVNQGFTDGMLKRWEEVERRKPTSTWKGFQYGATVPRPGQKRHKPNAQTNYSPAAEVRPILSGTTQELMNSINYERTAYGVRVYAETAYAKVQNEGGAIKIFGRTPGKIPQRQFIGQSKVLKEKIMRIIEADIKKILR